MNLDDIITLAELGETLGLSPETLRHQAANGRLEARLVGKTWITTKQEGERYRREQLGKLGRTGPATEFAYRNPTSGWGIIANLTGPIADPTADEGVDAREALVQIVDQATDGNHLTALLEQKLGHHLIARAADIDRRSKVVVVNVRRVGHTKWSEIRRSKGAPDHEPPTDAT